MGGRSMTDVGGAVLAGSSPPFLGRERAAVDVDVGPERRSSRYHETCLALESVEEGSAAVSKPRCVWLRVPVVPNLKEACRLPVRGWTMKVPGRISQEDRRMLQKNDRPNADGSRY